MREIKFRGKRIDGKGWAYGFYVQMKGKHKTVHYIYTGDVDTGTEGFINRHRVLPETVGQFIDRFSRDRVKIYEGDMVRREVCSPDDMAHGIYGYAGIVKWERGKFIIECDEDNSFYDHMGDLFSWNELEVIGNIYENKEFIS